MKRVVIFFAGIFRKNKLFLLCILLFGCATMQTQIPSELRIEIRDENDKPRKNFSYMEEQVTDLDGYGENRKTNEDGIAYINIHDRPKTIFIRLWFDESKSEQQDGLNIVDQKLNQALKCIYDGKIGVALTLCKEVLSLEPKNILALMRLGSAYWGVGNTSKARIAWRQALKYDPGNDQMLKFLEMKEKKEPACSDFEVESEIQTEYEYGREIRLYKPYVVEYEIFVANNELSIKRSDFIFEVTKNDSKSLPDSLAIRKILIEGENIFSVTVSESKMQSDKNKSIAIEEQKKEKERLKRTAEEQKIKEKEEKKYWDNLEINLVKIVKEFHRIELLVSKLEYELSYYTLSKDMSAKQQEIINYRYKLTEMSTSMSQLIGDYINKFGSEAFRDMTIKNNIQFILNE